MTTKELSYCNDLLNQEKTLITKCQDYSSQISDTTLKNLCNRLAEKHLQNYNSIYQQLNS